ncbi:hypothetical protein [Synechococcus sp. JA-2-3B'a(2-13)]|uniref:hypothetical protein n=1 Tax=Synechococcus sp. (strain JA-2-3B'a(2-13)) TaxID=321332 RepID=UPI00164F669C|nr:hypothetical protein [Synechococcus sp. JA-2-3B'a(2-13)]
MITDTQPPETMSCSDLDSAQAVDNTAAVCFMGLWIPACFFSLSAGPKTMAAYCEDGVTPFLSSEERLRVREKMPVEPYADPGLLLARLHHLMKRLLPNGKMEKVKQNP